MLEIDALHQFVSIMQHIFINQMATVSHISAAQQSVSVVYVHSGEVTRVCLSELLMHCFLSQCSAHKEKNTHGWMKCLNYSCVAQIQTHLTKQKNTS